MPRHRGDTTFMELAKHCIIHPESNVRLEKLDPDETFGTKRNDKAHDKTLIRLRELQHLLYADKRYALLIVLQGLDAAGKDGTIRHVMSGVNPQGCDVTSFKAPTAEEWPATICGASTRPFRRRATSASSTARTMRMS
jgi:polyphosphate kinase 2 (PPK2 family)